MKRSPLSLIGVFARRPRLLVSAGLGLASAAFLLAVGVAPSGLQAALLAWDVGAASFILLTLQEMRAQSSDQLRLRCARTDEGQGLILTLALAAAAASVGAVVLEVSAAKQATGLVKIERLADAALTVALSWFVTHLVFALHYVHGYFRSDHRGGHVGGLDFPGTDDPDFWDFLYASLVIGAAAQTADVSFTHKALRRIGSLHCVIAFVFNTAVLALGVNLAAGLV